MKVLALLGFLSLGVATPLIAKDKGFKLESKTQQTHLIELFSSEGCSSCPPAERWLAALMSDKNLWKTFVPLEFHVDYWNKLGWVDPFSQETYTERQHRYAHAWRARSVYTPGFVLNGKEWRSRRTSEFHKHGPNVGKLTVKRLAGEKYSVEFAPVGKPSKSYKVSGAILGHGLKVRVPKGENAGQTLRHEFVVLSMKTNQLTRKGKKFVGEMKLSKKLKIKPASLSVAFWVSAQSQAPIQAVGGPI